MSSEDLRPYHKKDKGSGQEAADALAAVLTHAAERDEAAEHKQGPKKQSKWMLIIICISTDGKLKYRPLLDILFLCQILQLFIDPFSIMVIMPHISAWINMKIIDMPKSILEETLKIPMLEVLFWRQTNYSKHLVQELTQILINL